MSARTSSAAASAGHAAANEHHQDGPPGPPACSRLMEDLDRGNRRGALRKANDSDRPLLPPTAAARSVADRKPTAGARARGGRQAYRANVGGLVGIARAIAGTSASTGLPSIASANTASKARHLIRRPATGRTSAARRAGETVTCVCAMRLTRFR